MAGPAIQRRHDVSEWEDSSSSGICVLDRQERQHCQSTGLGAGITPVRVFRTRLLTTGGRDGWSLWLQSQNDVIADDKGLI